MDILAAVGAGAGRSTEGVMGIVARVREYAKLGDGEAVAMDGLSLGWPQLVERVEAGAAALHAAGIGPGATVGITITDELEHFVASLSLLRVGAWQIALASHDTEVERGAIAERARVTDVLLGSRGEPRTNGVDHHHPWPLPPAKGGAPSVTEGGVLLRTSGTTGSMNIVPLAGAELVAQAERNPEYANGRLFRPASIEHNNSKRHRLYCLAMGGTNVLAPTGPLDVVEYCRRHRVTTLDLALLQAADLAAQPRVGLAEVDVRVSGSAVPQSVRERIEHNLTRRLHVRYGSTESGTVSVAGPGEHDAGEPVGRVVPGIELEIVDDEGRRLGPGEPGQIRMRGDGMTRGYLGAAEQNAKRFRDGWFWPGDIGSLDDHGTLRILGRADDMINLNGINIFPSEIERVLEQHPAVRSAAALPLSSTNHGQIPVAAVELHRRGLVMDRELVAYAREHLALRAPRRILILDVLPRNGQGKVLRREIAALFTTRG